MTEDLKNVLNENIKISTPLEKYYLLSSLHVPLYIYLKHNYDGSWKNLSSKMLDLYNLGPIGEYTVVKLIERLNGAAGVNIYSDLHKTTFSKVIESANNIKDEYLIAILNKIKEETIAETVLSTSLKLESSNRNAELKHLLTEKYTIVDFWASWCSPCIKAFPKIEKLIETENQKPQVVCIAFDDYKKVLKRIDKVGEFRNMQLFYADKEEVLKQNLQVRAFPSYIIIDDSGKVVSSTFHTFNEVLKEWKSLNLEPCTFRLAP